MRRILLVLMFLALFAVPAFAQTPTATPTAAFDFPNAPTQGQSVSGPSGQTLTWDGSKWVAVGGVTGNYAPLVNVPNGQNNYAPINAPSFTGLTIASQMQVANTLSAPTASFGNTTITSGGILMLAGSAAMYFNGVAPGGTCAAGSAVTSISATIVPTCSPMVTGGPFLPVASPTFTGTLTGPSASLGTLALGSSGSWNSGGLTVNSTATFNATITFPDGSSIVNAGANNGTGGFTYGFQNSTGIAIGTQRTGSTTIGGKMLILGQSTTPALLLQAPGYVPDGAIIFTTSVTGNEWITHNATYDGTTWTGWGNDAEILTFGNAPSTRFSVFGNQGLTVGQAFTPTEIAQFNSNGLNLLTGSLFIGSNNQFQVGTWTPTFSCAGGNPAVSGSASGQYVIVGNMLWYQGHMGWGSATGGSGQGLIGGLPYPVIDPAGNGILVDAILIDNASSPSGLPTMDAAIFNGNNYIQTYETNFGSAGYLYPLPCANLYANSPSNGRFNGWYRFR